MTSWAARNRSNGSGSAAAPNPKYKKKTVNVMPSSEMIYKCDKTIAGSIKEAIFCCVEVERPLLASTARVGLATVIGY